MFLTPKVIIFETHEHSLPKFEYWFTILWEYSSFFYTTKSLEYWFTIYINQTHYSYGMNELIWNKALFENGGTLWGETFTGFEARTNNNRTSDFWPHIFTKNLKTLGLWVISAIYCSTSTLLTNVNLTNTWYISTEKRKKNTRQLANNRYKC
jgi:hypothetical protein